MDPLNLSEVLMYDIVASMPQASMRLANQIAGFCKLEYLLNYRRYQLDFLYVDTHPLLLQTDHATIAWQVQARLLVWPGIV